MSPAVAGRSEDRRRQMSTISGWLYGTGGLVTFVVSLIPNTAAGYLAPWQTLLSITAMSAGVFLLVRRGTFPEWFFHLLLIHAIGIISLSAYLGGEIGSSEAMFYAWAGAFVFTFFTRKQAIAYTAYMAAAYGTVLALGDEFSYPFARWAYAVSTMAATGAMFRWLVMKVDVARRDLATLNETLEHRVQEQVGEIERFVDELRSSRQRLVAAQDAERRRLERDLHDGAQQQVVALKIHLGLIGSMLESGETDLALDALASTKLAVDEAVQSLRDLAHGIYPPLLASDGLGRALRSHADRAGIDVDVEVDDAGRFPQDVEAAVYYCCLEAIQNATKYAEATRVRVVVAYDRADGVLCFSVSDDGKGFDVTTVSTGHGLTNLSDRMSALGGTLTVSSSVGLGTTIEGTLPASLVAAAT